MVAIVIELLGLGDISLIMGKAFDGFDETKERLDLLALDKEGGLEPSPP